VVEMRKIKIVLGILLVIIVSLTTYAHFKKEPVESVPKRATLVQNTIFEYEKEVVTG
jgi:hypothetical protein